MRIVSPDLVSGKVVLIRMDLDVPIKEGKVQDDLRILAGLPTLEMCIQYAKSVIICGHIGRPGGKEDPNLSVAPIVRLLEDLYGDFLFPEDKLHVLENLRFESGEDGFGDFFTFVSI